MSRVAPNSPRYTRSVHSPRRRTPPRGGFRFAGSHTREDGPPKPAPDGVLELCARFGVAPHQSITVGDYKFDVLAGRAAGTRTALVAPEPPADLEAWGPPDLVVSSLRDLLRMWDG